MKKRKIKILSIAVLSSIFMGFGIGCSDADSKNTSNNNFFTTTTSSNDNIQVIGDTDNSLELTSGSKVLMYSDSLDAYLIVDNENYEDYSFSGDLYSLNKSGEKNLISQNISSFLFSTRLCESGDDLYYLTNDNTLFKKDKDDTKSTEIATNIETVSSKKDDVVIYSTHSSEVYIKINNKDSKKLSDTSSSFYVSDDGNKVAYLKDDGLYYYDVLNDSEEIIDNFDTSSYSNLSSVKFNKDKGIFYTIIAGTDSGMLTDYKLKYKAYGKDSIDIQSNRVSSFIPSDDGKGVYYSTYSKSLFSKLDWETKDHSSYYEGVFYLDLKSNESTKIYDSNISHLRLTDEGVFVIDTDDILYKVNSNGNKERITQDVSSEAFSSYYNIPAFLNNNNELYLGTSKIADNVKKFFCNSDSLAYLTNDNKVFLVNDKTPELIIDNAKEYSSITFNNIPLYTTTFEVSDIIGYFQQEENPNVMIGFNENAVNFVTNYLDESFDFDTFSTLSSSNYLTLALDNKSKTYMTIENIDGDSIKIDEKLYTRIDENTFNTFATKEKTARSTIDKNSSASSLGEEIQCIGVYNKNNMYYFLYQIGDYSIRMIDENGDFYDYNSNFVDSSFDIEKIDPNPPDLSDIAD